MQERMVLLKVRRRVVKVYLVAVLSTMLGLAGATGALALDYDEAIDGDLPGSATVLLLEIGMNTVSGEFTFSSNELLIDFDRFVFQIPVRGALTSALVTSSDVTGDVVQSSWYLGTLPPNATLLQSITVHSPGSAQFTSLPLSTGFYQIGMNSVIASFPVPPVDPRIAVGSYRFTLIVESVPEPSSFVLVNFCIFSLAFRRRFRPHLRKAGGRR